MRSLDREGLGKKRTVVSPGVDHLEQQLVSPTPGQPWFPVIFFIYFPLQLTQPPSPTATSQHLLTCSAQGWAHFFALRINWVTLLKRSSERRIMLPKGESSAPIEKWLPTVTSDVRIGHFNPVFLILPLARRANVFTVMHISELCCLCKAGEIWPRAFHFSPFIFHLHSFNHLYSEYRGKYLILCNLRAPFFWFFNKTTFQLKWTEKGSSWTETVLSSVVVGFIAQTVFRLE